MNAKIDQKLEKANVAFEQGDLQSALKYLNEILKREPSHCDALHLFALTSYRLGQKQQALEILQQCLRVHQEFAVGFNSLAVVFRDLEQYEASANACLQAIRLKEDYPEAHYNLGNARLFQGYLDQAEQAFLKALSIRDDYGLVFLNLGIVYQRKDEIEDAIESFERAAELLPGDSRIYLNLGNAYSMQGKKEKAASIYAQGLEISPQDYQLFYHFALSRKHHEEDDVIKNGRARFSSSQIPEEEKIFLGFSLGKAFEDLGEYENSFHYYAAANRLQNSKQPFDDQNLKVFLENIRHVFQEWNLPELSTETGGITPVFIVGMPRSGTTLVEQILSCHSKVEARGELDMLPRVVYQTCQAGQGGFPFALKGFSEKILRPMRDQYMKMLCAPGGDGSHFTDKMPQNFLLLGVIKGLFPEAKIIHCTRDPLDLCLSCFKHHFIEQHSYAYSLGDLGRYFRFYESVMGFWEDHLQIESIFKIRYESLVQNQEEITRKLLEFCGLGFEQGCLEFHQNHRVVHTASMNQVRKPIYKSSIGAWKHYEPWIGELKDALGI